MTGSGRFCAFDPSPETDVQTDRPGTGVFICREGARSGHRDMRPAMQRASLKHGRFRSHSMI